MPLLLLPNLLEETLDHTLFLPKSVDEAVATLDGLIAESDRRGRRYLRHFMSPQEAHQIPIALLNKNSSPAYLDFLLEPLLRGETWGLVSDAGLPCIADPGSALVLRAREGGLPITAFIGPSSILLALMLSGLSGKRFSFQGYIAKNPKPDLIEWEKRSKREGETILFIETPYRNMPTFNCALETLHASTLFSIASNLTLPTQEVRTASISQWKKSPPLNLHKSPTLFLFNASHI